MKLFSSLVDAPNWELQYALLIEAGKNNSLFPEEFRIPMFRIEGCNAPTWLRLYKNNSKIILEGYSKSHIVQGLIVLLKEYIDEHTSQEISQVDPNFFDQLHLSELITPTRQNGFNTMLQKIQEYARQ